MSNPTSIWRRGENAKSSRGPNRGNRFFKLGDNWYFNTREGFSMGPYESRDLASKGTEDFLAFIGMADSNILKLLTPKTQALGT